MKGHWQRTRLGDVIRLEYGKPLDEDERTPDGQYPVYGANGEKGRSDRYYFDRPSIIVGRKGSAGELNLTEERFWPLDVTYFVTFDEQRHSVRFLYYLLSTLDLPRFARGVKPGINRNEIYAQTVIITPLAGQRRIARLLDEAFEAIETAKAKAAINLLNARAILANHLEISLNQRGDGWSEAPLSEFCDIKHGYAFQGADFSSGVVEGNPLIVTPGNFTEDGRLVFDEKNSKRFSGAAPDGFQFDVGDLVVVMTDLSTKMKILGKPAFVEVPGVLHNQRIGRVVFKNGALDARFLYYYFMSNRFLAAIKASSTGTMVKHTAPNRILSNVIRFPADRTRQMAIVEALDLLRMQTQRLESIYGKKLDALDALKKSLLHEAFSGNL